MPDSRSASTRRMTAVRGVLLLVQALVLTIVLTMHAPVLLPVTEELSGDRRALAEVSVGAAAVAVLVVASIAGFTGLLLSPGVARLLRWAEFSLTSSITVFLVAQLNGITEVTTLVAIYAMTSAIALFAVLQERGETQSGHPMLPLSFGAAIGVVPFGLIAFAQVGSSILGEGPPPAVRVITLTMLAAMALVVAARWRGASPNRGRSGPDGGGSPERAHLVITGAAWSVFAWAVVLGVVVPGAV